MREVVLFIFLVGEVLYGVDSQFHETKDVEEFQIPFNDSNACDDDTDVREDVEADIDNAVTRSWTKILSVRNGGGWGNWGPIKFCPCGTFGVGYDMKIEPKVRRDNTALNAIKLLCADKKGRVRAKITSTQAKWGSWVGEMKCSARRHLSAFDLQVEKYRLYQDDTAANYVKFKCRNPCGFEYELVKPPGHGYWGTWGAWSAGCPKGSGICGIQTKVEKYQGYNGDDTALNDVKFYCCELPKKTDTST